MLESKLARTRAIIEVVCAMDQEHGVRCPSAGGRPEARARLIDPPREPWRARVTPDRRMTIGRLYGNIVGDRILEAEGWHLVQVFAHNELRMVANINGEELELHYFRPGIWEGWFGADPGSDTQVYSRLPFGDPNSSEWQSLEQSDDFQLPPLRGRGLGQTRPKRGDRPSS